MFCAVSPFASELPLAEVFQGLHVIDIGIIVQIADALAEVMLQGIDEVAQVLLIRLLNLDLIDLIAVDQEANGQLGHGCLPSVSRQRFHGAQPHRPLSCQAGSLYVYAEHRAWDGIPDLWLTGWLGRYYGNRQDAPHHGGGMV